MIAKFDGECGVSGRAIVEGQSEIVKQGKSWILAEYATPAGAAAYVQNELHNEFQTILVQLAEMEPAKAEQRSVNVEKWLAKATQQAQAGTEIVNIAFEARNGTPAPTACIRGLAKSLAAARERAAWKR